MKLVISLFSICLFLFTSGYAIENNGKGMQILEDSARDNQYLFLFFYKEQNPRMLQGSQVFDQTIQTLNVPVKSMKINVTDPNERAIVSKFEVQRAPMPLVLVIAPNGAITGGFPSQFTEAQLKNAMISPGMTGSLKGLQDRKLVFLCIQNNQTRDNAAALKGMEEMRQDPRFNNAVELVFIDPSDTREANFLNQFNINPTTPQAITVFLAPPGDKIGVYQGATRKEQLVSDLKKASSSCCPDGCCPGGCCPGGCCK